jgi:molecular chaperone DnaK
VRAAVKEVRDSLESGSKEELDSKLEALNTAMTKVSEQIYAAASAESAAGDGNAEDGSAADEEEVVDAEVVDEEGK